MEIISDLIEQKSISLSEIGVFSGGSENRGLHV
jgi:hypothetical protein